MTLKSRTEKRHMRSTKLNLQNLLGANFRILAILAFALLACLPAGAQAQQKGQKTFGSAQEAVDALVAAAKSRNEGALLAILGPDGKEIISSGDAAEDEANRTNFAKKYEEMHRLVAEPDGMTMLYFGTEAGKQEILYRRVGKNEMAAIRVCQELVAAQNEYFAKQKNEYAQKFPSDEGQLNGLYWVGCGNDFEEP